MIVSIDCAGLVSLTEMKAKQEDVVKERERQLAVKGEAARLEVEEVNRRKAEKKKQKQVIVFSSFWRGEAGNLSLMYGYSCCFFHCSLLLAFSIHLSSSSAFPRSIFRQFSHHRALGSFLFSATSLFLCLRSFR